MIAPRLAAQWLNTVLMMSPAKASAIIAGLGARVTGHEIDFAGPEPVAHVAFANGHLMGTVGDSMGRSLARANRKAYDQVGNVAIIAIEGTLVHKGAWLDSNSGETSYQGIQTQVQAARRDPSVAGVVFEVDSFGGQVAGAFETADMIAALTAEKPTMAVLSDHAMSGGYLLASAARAVIIPESGAAGSIGIITIHADMSAAVAAAGLKMTVLTAGEFKAEGNSFEPLPDHVAERIRGELEGTRKMFAGAVSRYRGKRLSFDSAMATEARVYTGAEAVKAGLADATGHPGEAFKAFYSQLNRA